MAEQEIGSGERVGRGVADPAGRGLVVKSGPLYECGEESKFNERRRRMV